jgi:signal transduction histidine kinase
MAEIKENNQTHYGVSQAEAAHKKFTAKLVIPILGSGSLAFYVAVVSFPATKAVYVVCAIGVVGCLLNAWVTKKSGQWKNSDFRIRADRIDAVRWALNFLILDVALVIILKPTTASLVAIWTLLLICAQADLFRQSYRVIVLVIGWVTGTALVFYAPSDSLPWREQILVCFLMGLCVFIFQKMERHWINELISGIRSKTINDEMSRDALIGAQSRMISHELASLIVSIEVATHKPNEVDVAKLAKSLEIIKNLNRLVLSDLNDSQTKDEVTFGEIVKTIELLLVKEFRTYGIEIKISIEEEARSETFMEFSGSLFLILRNIIKNASEAAVEHHGRGGGAQVEVDARMGAQHLELSVSDNGAGMNQEQMEMAKAGEIETTKEDGYGIGLRFVAIQCERNGFVVDVESGEGEGTKFLIKIPLAKAA